MLFLGDLKIKTAIELGLEDIQKNPWLISDILGDCLSNPYLRERYGNQIESCIQWFQNNRINIWLSERPDKMDFPAVTIALGDCNEREEMKSMGDLSPFKTQLIPNKINKPIPFVVNPGAFTYNSTTGYFNFTNAIPDITLLAPGMILVDPATGTGFTILSIDSSGISIGPNLTLAAEVYGILPQFQFYEAKIGHTFFNESYTIGCHGVDEQTTLWLYSIVMYSLLRYRAALLERNGFAQSLIKSSGIFRNNDFTDEAQSIWSRSITISGQTENSWIMAPHRLISTVAFKDPNPPNPPTPANSYVGGIKIISNLTTQGDLSGLDWTTIADEIE